MDTMNRAAILGQIARFIIESEASPIRKSQAMSALYRGEVRTALSILG